MPRKSSSQLKKKKLAFFPQGRNTSFWKFSKMLMSINAFEFWCWRSHLRMLWRAKKAVQWIIEQINPGFSLKTQMTRIKLSYLGHIVHNPSSLKKALMLGGVEGKRARNKVDELKLQWQKVCPERPEGLGWVQIVLESIYPRSHQESRKIWWHIVNRITSCRCLPYFVMEPWIPRKQAAMPCGREPRSCPSLWRLPQCGKSLTHSKVRTDLPCCLFETALFQYPFKAEGVIYQELQWSAEVFLNPWRTA